MDYNSKYEIIIIDVDNSVVMQDRLKEKYNPLIIPMQDKSELLRFYCHHSEMILLKETILKVSKTNKPKIILYGSGDYHNLAYLGFSLIHEPVTIIHFDNHTDFWKFPFKNYHFFGDWIVWALKQSNIKKIIQFGVDGDLCNKKGMPPVGTFTHRLDFLLNQSVEMFPFNMSKSQFWGRIKADLPCVQFKPHGLKTDAVWNNIKNNTDFETYISTIIDRIPTELVYFSIDKDVLPEQENFAAYWDMQGSMDFESMKNIIKRIIKKKQVIGIDICGDGSTTIKRKNFIKKSMLKAKEKKHILDEFHLVENIEMNESINIQLIDLFTNQIAE